MTTPYAVPNFAKRILDFSAEIEYERVDSASQRDEAYRLRYMCYLAEGAIMSNSQESFSDIFDEDANCFIYLVRFRGRVVSSVRLHVACEAHPHSPSMIAFPDVLQPIVERGEAYVDPTRFVINPGIRSITTMMPYATLRLASMAADHFNAGHIIATARIEHTPFYRRIFRLEPRTEARAYPGLIKPLCLMSNDTGTIREKVYSRYPIFSSDPEERSDVFGPSRSLDMIGAAPSVSNDNEDARDFGEVDGPLYRRYPLPEPRIKTGS